MDEVSIGECTLCEYAIFVCVINLSKDVFDRCGWVPLLLHSIQIFFEVHWFYLTIFLKKGLEDLPEICVCTAYQVVLQVLFVRFWYRVQESRCESFVHIGDIVILCFGGLPLESSVFPVGCIDCHREVW